MGILEARGITKRFGGLTAVNDYPLKWIRKYLHIAKRIRKTTVFNMISLFPITAGEIYFNDKGLMRYRLAKYVKLASEGPFRWSACGE